MEFNCLSFASIDICRLRWFNGIAIVVVVFWFFVLAEDPKAKEPARLVFRDVTQQSGVNFRHTHGGCGKYYIVETVTAGLCLFDYDGDGDDDIYFLNGAPLAGCPQQEKTTNKLFRNDGGLHFTDVTAQAGVGDTGYGLGVVAGDYNNDGFLDLFVNNYGRKVLYRNNKDGTFSDVTVEAGVDNGSRVGAGALFLDIDADGWLDLYVGNYIVFDESKHIFHQLTGIPVYGSPEEYPPDKDTLFKNNGDGTFRDVTEISGIGRVAGTSMGMVAGDFDNDGDTDIFVGNDVRANFLFVNDGKGYFTESALERGVAYNGYGDENASMGVDCGDYDNDGWLDLFMSDYQNEWPVLYKNTGNGFFEDVTFSTGAGGRAYPYVNWGVGLVDFDNDGDKDIFIGNGHINDRIGEIDDTTAYRVANAVLRNDGGKFVDVSATAGDLPNLVKSTRGVAFADLDLDGRVDVVILNSQDTADILRNVTDTDNHWIQIDLRQTGKNCFGVGSRVKVVAGELVQYDEVHAGRGYQSHWGLRLHFGLGSHDRVDRLEVHWHGGGHDIIENIPADQIITVSPGGRWSRSRIPGH